MKYERKLNALLAGIGRSVGEPFFDKKISLKMSTRKKSMYKISSSGSIT